MFKIIFLLFLLAHIIGDYYLQSCKLADEKVESVKALIKHSVIYTFACFMVVIPFFDSRLLIGSMLLSLGHAVIDLIKFLYTKYQKEITQNKKRNIYISDQILHLMFISIITYIFTVNGYTISVLPTLKNIADIIGAPLKQCFLWLLAILLIWKPTNITIKKMLSMYKPAETNENTQESAGGFIGLLERLVMLVLLSIGQYSAIGLVLTAKSIARYDKISKDKAFAEYYLLGTLLSAISAIVVHLVII
ncbi:MAG: DUF3307 domain-containing protein [Oscillospiraceae bacterium]|nr:DUF3307 domain-containing protein [Oscillospiraceae bacterium]MDD4413711.1 DUF3307 domain-containing protein [Oscillospiraceae bacterium]